MVSAAGTLGVGALIGSALVIRYLLDTLVPPVDYRMRAAVLGAVCITMGIAGAVLGKWTSRVTARG